MFKVQACKFAIVLQLVQPDVLSRRHTAVLILYYIRYELACSHFNDLVVGRFRDLLLVGFAHRM